MDVGSERTVRVLHWGEVPYEEALLRQETLLQRLVTKKMTREAARQRHSSAAAAPPNYLILCTHPPVFTLGKSGDSGHLLVSKRRLKQEGIGFYETSRGGDITYHGPGQLVVYPILDLNHFFTDLHKYLRFLEEVIIRTLGDYGLRGQRIEKLTGVWVGQRKIAALGVRSSRWVTMHGLALNVHTNLKHFDYIVPCGIKDKAVTSIEKEIGESFSVEETGMRLLEHMSSVFRMTLET